MLRFTKINPTGFFSFGITELTELDNLGLVHLQGINEDRDSDSNGAGKSSLFNALCEIVWGINPTSCSGASCINNVLGKGFCGRVELIADDAKTYRITYARDWKDELYPVDNDNGVEYKGTSIFFEVFEDGIWRDLRGASMAETRKVIQNTIGLTYERFLASSYLSPRTGNLILKGSNKERMEIMSGIVGLSDWDMVLDASKDCRRAIQSEVTDIEKKLSFVEGVYSETVSERDKLASTDWKKSINEHTEYVGKLRINESTQAAQQESLLTQLQEAMEKRSTGATPIRNEISNLKREVSILESRSREPFVETDEIRFLTQGIGRLNGSASITEGKLKAQKASQNIDTIEIRALTTEIRNSEGELGVVEGKLRTYKTKDGTSLTLDACPTCGSKEFWEDIKGSLLSQQEALEKEISKISKQIEKKKKELDKLVKKQKNALELELVNELANLQKQIEEKKTALHAAVEVQQKTRESYINEGKEKATQLQSKIIELEAQAKQVEAQATEIEKQINLINIQRRDVEAELTKIRTEIANALSRIEQYKGMISRLDDLNTRVLAKAAEMAELQSEIDKLKDDGNYYEWLIKHAPFIKLHKLSVSLVELSGIVNGYLSDIGDTIRVNISSFSEKKGKVKGSLADSLKSEVEITITDGDKIIDPHLYSDGETGRISLTIARALHDMSVNKGSGCNLTFLDEVFAFVDHASSQKISNLFTQCGETVVVTDNSGRASDLLNFDGVWTVRKRNGITQVEA